MIWLGFRCTFRCTFHKFYFGILRVTWEEPPRYRTTSYVTSVSKISHEKDKLMTFLRRTNFLPNFIKFFVFFTSFYTDIMILKCLYRFYYSLLDKICLWLEFFHRKWPNRDFVDFDRRFLSEILNFSQIWPWWILNF